MEVCILTAQLPNYLLTISFCTYINLCLFIFQHASFFTTLDLFLLIHTYVYTIHIHIIYMYFYSFTTYPFFFCLVASQCVVVCWRMLAYGVRDLSVAAL